MEIRVYRNSRIDRPRIVLLLVFGISLSLMFGYCAVQIKELQYWTPSTLQSELDLVFPDDALLLIEGTQQLPSVSVSFTAQSSQVSEFVAQICDGILYDGFDPFTVVESVEPIPGSFLIEDDYSYYFAYSPFTLDTTRGITCVQNRVMNIVVEPINYSNTYTVRLEVHFVSSLAGYANQVNYKDNWQPYESSE